MRFADIPMIGRRDFLPKYVNTSFPGRSGSASENPARLAKRRAGDSGGICEVAPAALGAGRVAQRVVGSALSYEDLVDHDELRHDLVMATRAGKLRRSNIDAAAGSVDAGQWERRTPRDRQGEVGRAARPTRALW